MADKLAAALHGGTAGGGSIVVQGDINVDAGDRDAAALTDAIVAELRGRSYAGFSPLAGVLLTR